MAQIDIINDRLEEYTEEAEAIKEKIEKVARNKNISVESNIDTPLSVLTKIDNSTIKTPTDSINIVSNGTTNVQNYASAIVNVQPNLQAKSTTIASNGTINISPDTGYDGLQSVQVTTNVPSGGGDEPTPIPVTPYVRPTDWLTMPSLDNTKDDIYILLGVGSNCLNQIRFQLSGSGTIDWGDGSAIETFTNASQTEFYHYYNEADISTSTWTEHNYSKQVVVHIQANRNAVTYFSTRCRYPYTDATGTTKYITAVNGLSSDIYEIDATVASSEVYIGAVNTSTVAAPPRLLEIFNWDGDITNTNVNNFFAFCNSLRQISTLNFTGNITNMQFMFAYCHELQEIQDLSSKMTRVTNISSMFVDCYSLRDISWFLIPASCTSLSSLFAECRSLVTIPELSSDNSIALSSVFYNCTNLKLLKGLNFSKVTNLQGTFQGCTSIETIDLSHISTTTAMNSFSLTFSGCSSLKSINLSNIDTSSVTSMQGLFNNCYALESVNLTNLNTSKVTNMSSMFNYCKSLLGLDLSSFDTSKVTNMSNMFGYCTALKELDLSSFDTSKVTNMSYMFSNCSSLIKLDISNFKTSAVTNMGSMFTYCTNLKAANLRVLNTSNTTNLSSAFQAFTLSAGPIYIDATKVTNLSSLFSNCHQLKRVAFYNLNPNYSSSLVLPITSMLQMSKQNLIDLFNSLATNVNNRTRSIQMGTTMQGYLANTYVRDSGALYTIILPTSDTTIQSGKEYYTYDDATETYNRTTPDFTKNIVYYELKTATWNKYVLCSSSDSGAMLALDYVRNIKKYTVS